LVTPAVSEPPDNLHLHVGSLALDTGDNDVMISVPTDMDGKPRIVDGYFDGTPTVDMGTYETPALYYLPLMSH